MKRNQANQAERARIIAIKPEDDRSLHAQMRRRKIWLSSLFVLSVALFCAGQALAQSNSDTINGAAPDAPPPLTAEDLARAINTDDSRITATRTRTSDGVVTEYRDGTRTYLIQVDPRSGLPYYAIDTDGDGTPENWRENTESDVSISKWKIVGW